MTKESVEHFMFGLKNYHWKRNPALYKHVEYVLDTLFEDFEEELKEVRGQFMNSYEASRTSSPSGAIGFDDNSFKPNTRYDIHIIESKDQS